MSWVIAVKSATANQTIRATDGRTYLHRLGGYDTITTSTPDSVTGLTSILSVSMHTASGTASTGQPTTAPWALDGLKLSSAENLGTTAWVGFFFAITSANVSGKIVHIPYGFGGTVDSSRVATNGLIVVLADASNNYLAYQVLAQAKWTIQGSGTISLKNEALDMQLKVIPKDATVLSLRSPIHIQGSLKKPAVRIDKAALAARGGVGAALGLLLTPIGAMLAFIEPGLGKDSQCLAYIKELDKKTGGAIP